MSAMCAQMSRHVVEQDMLDGEVMPFCGGMAAVFSRRAPGKETANEDAAAILPYDDQSGVLLVADGVGGLRDGASASRVAVERMSLAVEQAADIQADLREAILNGIEAANAELCSTGTGTTLAAVEIQGSQVRPYHVGDSMILVVGQRGRVKLQTICHSPVGYAVESGLLDEAEAMHHDQRHVVSNIVGVQEMRIEMGSALSLDPRDTLLVASDGVFDNLHLDEVIETIRKGPLAQVAQQLADACQARMVAAGKNEPSKPDDLTFILFRR